MQKDAGVEWYYKTPMIILWILMLGPFAIPFIRKNPQLSNRAKTILITTTILITIFALVLVVLVVIYAPIIAFNLITGKNASDGLSIFNF